jgi:BASS family bile acid:Na+ symporter
MSQFQHFVETVVIPTQLVLAMVGMGATLTVRDFQAVLEERTSVLLGLALQYLLVPALALAFIHLFELSTGWALGLLVVAVVPGGAVSNLFTFLARGNAALSLSVTLLTTTASVFTTPLLLGMLAQGHGSLAMEIPTARIMLEIFAYLVVPLGAGMVFLRYRPWLAAPVSTWSVHASLALVIVIIVSSLGSGRIRVGEYGFAPPLMLSLFGASLVAFTSLVCRLTNRFPRDTVALSIEVSMSNIGLALLVARPFFPDDPARGQLLYTVLFFGGLTYFLGAPLAMAHRFAGRGLLGLPTDRPPAASTGGADAPP